MEIERKFLVAKKPDVSGLHGAEIRQWYLSYNPEIRVRLIDGTYFLTEKSGSGLSREEIERELSKKEEKCLLEECTEKPVEKTRYKIPLGEYTAEYDVYAGENEGLFIVEIEFPTVEAALSFEPPSWFGKDVTEDVYYKNSSISKRINGRE